MKSLLLTYALTYGGAFVSVFNPYIGFLIYVCFAIIKPDSLWHWAVPQGSYSRIVAVALLLGWTLHGFGKWQFGKAKAPILAIIGYWIVLVLHGFAASNQRLAWDTVEAMTKIFLPLIVGMSLIDSVARLKQLCWVMVLSQGFLAYEFNLSYYAGYIRSGEMFHGGLDNNGVAITLVTSIGMAFFLGMHAERWWQRVLALGLSALMAHAILFSHSRGGMIALIITSVATFLLIPKQPKHFLIFAVAILLVARLAGDGVQQRFLTIFSNEQGIDSRGGGRLDFWAACWDSMLHHPLGVGTGRWPDVAAEYGFGNRPAHTTWLQIGAELGFPGILCLLSFYGICCGRLWQLTKDRTYVADPWFRYLSRMVIASLVGFFVSAQFVTVDGIELPYYVTLLGCGVLKLAYMPLAPGSTSELFLESTVSEAADEGEQLERLAYSEETST